MCPGETPTPNLADATTALCSWATGLPVNQFKYTLRKNEKSFLEREEIYAKENFETIEEAIRYKKILKLQSATAEVLKLKPYRIIPDPLSMYHYLIGYAVPESDSPESEPYSYSCRISNLKYIKMLHEKSFITQNDKKSLEKALKSPQAQLILKSVLKDGKNDGRTGR